MVSLGVACSRFMGCFVVVVLINNRIDTMVGFSIISRSACLGSLQFINLHVGST